MRICTDHDLHYSGWSRAPQHVRGAGPSDDTHAISAVTHDQLPSTNVLYIQLSAPSIVEAASIYWIGELRVGRQLVTSPALQSCLRSQHTSAGHSKAINNSMAHRHANGEPYLDARPMPMLCPPDACSATAHGAAAFILKEIVIGNAP